MSSHEQGSSAGYLDATAASINGNMSIVGDDVVLGVEGLSADPVKGESRSSSDSGKESRFPTLVWVNCEHLGHLGVFRGSSFVVLMGGLSRGRNHAIGLSYNSPLVSGVESGSWPAELYSLELGKHVVWRVESVCV